MVIGSDRRPAKEVEAGVVEDAALEGQPLDGRRAVVEGAQRIGHHEPGGRQPEEEQGNAIHSTKAYPGRTVGGRGDATTD